MDDTGASGHGCYTEHGVSGYGVAVNLSRESAMDETWIKAMAEEMMVRIADLCQARGAKAIGHIKAHVRTDAGTVKADTIGTSHGAFSQGVISQPVHELYMAVNSIVQGIKEQVVQEATLEGVHQVAEKRGLHVIKEKEHAYFDEFDFAKSPDEFKQELSAQLARDEAREGPEET